MSSDIRTVLFDLDGTLADTAPDLAYALNEVRREQGLEAMPYEQIRPVVSHGGIALIRLGFQLEPEQPQFEPLRDRLLQIYVNNIATQTTLFDGMETVLEQLEHRGMLWGVVTNKPAWLTDPLMQQMGLASRAATIISGDTLPQRKPHPAPMLLACEQTGSIAEQCLYIGDAERDIEAGRAAGMKTMVALFGYIEEHDRPEQWGADVMVKKPLAILDWLDSHSTISN